MKSQEETRRRLEKLRARYCRKYCAEVREKKPQNCRFNHEHAPSPRKPEIPTEVEIAPRVITSLVVIQPDFPIRLCMYGSSDPATWNGDLCDCDEVAQKCKLFQSRLAESAMASQFDLLMADDEYVYANYKDVAALQWVLGERVHAIPLSWWDRMLTWMDAVLRRASKPRKLPEAQSDIPGDMWQDADSENPGK